MNNNKKLLTLIGLGFSSVLNAGTMGDAQTEAINNSFYLGIGLGGITMHQESTSSSNLVLTSGASHSASSVVNNGTSLQLNSTLFGGYSWLLPHQFSLGIEGFGNYTNAGISSENSTTILGATGGGIGISGSGESKLKYMYGVRALPGYRLVPNFVVYGIGGYTRSHFNVTVNPSSIFVGNAVTTSSTITSGHNFNGYQAGLGSMFDITNHLSIRGDFIYGGYNTKNSVNSGSISGAIASSSGASSIKTSTFEADFSLVYRV